MSGYVNQLGHQPIPKGFRIFEKRLDVAGLKYRKADAAAFAASSKPWLELEREPNNEHDKNAIKLIGCSKGFFGTKRRFVGYAPKDIARTLVERDLFNAVRARLQETYLGSKGGIEIWFQIIGPKELYNKYRGID